MRGNAIAQSQAGFLMNFDLSCTLLYLGDAGTKSGMTNKKGQAF